MMEYVDGKTLRQLVPVQKMQNAIDYAIQGSLHKGGAVVRFTGSGLRERIMVSSGLPLKDFNLIRVLGGKDILGPIRAGDRYFVIGKVRLPDSRQVVNYWLSRRETFLRYYNVLSEDENYLLLEGKNPM